MFWVVAGLLTVGALLFIAMPLFRANRKQTSANRSEINLGIYRDQMQELDADLAAHTLSEAQYQKARDELEKRVLENTLADDATDAAPASGRWIIVAAVIAVPVLAISIYLFLGAPDGVNVQSMAVGPDMTQAQIEEMVAKLAKQLKEKPDDAQGWEMLARSYATLRRFGDSRDAYAKAARLTPDNAKLLIDYADVLAMTNGRNVVGEPEKLAQRALEIEPNNIKALALAATAAFQRTDYNRAIELWQRILKLVPPDSQVARAINANLSQVQGLSGQPLAVSREPASREAPASAVKPVSGNLSLEAVLKSRVAKTDTVFIFARDADTQRPPLAMIRTTVGELPLHFVMDDSISIMPNFKLSSATKVVIGARISKSGNAAPQPGDLQGTSLPVSVGDQSVRVIINTEVN
jgi:cytochrome c-type biogenesis protein CcmH